MRERDAVRVLLLSPEKRLLLIKYRNVGRDGVERPCWTTAGGGIESGESLGAAAAREIVEETDIAHAVIGPVVWYGEDSRRAGDWQICHKEHFIVAYAPTEQIGARNWTDHERREILEMRWWAIADIVASAETIYPPSLGNLMKPIVEGSFPDEILRLPDIAP